MSLLETTLKYIQTSERLIVVTVTLTVAGLICFFSERNGYLNFAGLPEWTRPAAQAVWVVSAVHVAIRTLMGFGALCRAALHRAISLPERYRRSRFENATIARLRGTGGLEREVLAFALHRDDDHISAEDSDQYRWLVSLRRKGLVEMTDADPRVVHYRIHPIAWRYMKSHPNQFVYRLPWAHAPWSEDYNETRMEAELDKRAAGKRTSFFRRWRPARRD
jgi:hypothetical protein